MDNKAKISVALFIVTFSLLLLSAYWFCEQRLYCGTIKYKVMDEIHYKHSAENDPILVITFNNGIVYNIHATWNDYLSAKVGDHVCYTLRIAQVESTLKNNGLTFIISFICTVIALIIMLTTTNII